MELLNSENTAQTKLAIAYFPRSRLLENLVPNIYPDTINLKRHPQQYLIFKTL